MFSAGLPAGAAYFKCSKATSEELLRELDGLIEQVRGSGELPVLTRGLLAKADALLHDRRAAEALQCNLGAALVMRMSISRHSKKNN